MKLTWLLFVILAFQQEAQKTYMPLIVGNSWLYRTADGRTYEDYVSKYTYEHNKIEYLQVFRKHSDETGEILYCRSDQSGTAYYLDNKTFRESIEVPAIPKLGLAWRSGEDNWRYKIVEINVDVKTPEHTFKDCVAIRAESPSQSEFVFVNYYCRGIGQVASKVDGKFAAYLVKWKINVKKA